MMIIGRKSASDGIGRSVEQTINRMGRAPRCSEPSENVELALYAGLNKRASVYA
jgi:hypothetical protein